MVCPLPYPAKRWDSKRAGEVESHLVRLLVGKSPLQAIYVCLSWSCSSVLMGVWNSQLLNQATTTLHAAFELPFSTIGCSAELALELDVLFFLEPSCGSHVGRQQAVGDVIPTGAMHHSKSTRFMALDLVGA